MTVSDYLVDYIIKLGVTDVFGIPGGVVLDFLYALEKRRPQINAHLSIHEQGAAFSASGYAQVSSKLGVAYATKGPGITNMVTSIADAYFESTPILIITAHSYSGQTSNRRIEIDQELDTEKIFSDIIKYYAKIEDIEDAVFEIQKACKIALSDRKGPVLLDFNKSIFNKEVNLSNNYNQENMIKEINESILKEIKNLVKNSDRPLFLMGDGIHQSNTEEQILKLANECDIPVVSSRYSQDIMPNSELYFGYIGSHGLRYSNFILEKSDLLIVFGNRMSFSTSSKSFKKFLKNRKIIRFEVDEAEFSRHIPGVESYNIDLKNIIPELIKSKLSYLSSNEWLKTCNKLQNKLNEYDIDDHILDISKLLKAIPCAIPIVNDVGNNEFWVSRAYAFSKVSNRILFSKSFGAMGSSLPKAIGAYYKARTPIICFVGDQGFQMNIQEIQFLVRDNLPIVIVVLNNSSSGMIRSRQKKLYNSNFVHTTIESGYSVPNLKSIALGYGIDYINFSDLNDINVFFKNIHGPSIVELSINENIDLLPDLLIGDSCQKMSPYLNDNLYDELNKL